MAAGILKKMLQGKGDYKVMTAGVSAFTGAGATQQTFQVMAENGIELTHHVSQRLTDGMLREADLILVMERVHKEHILKRLPAIGKKLYLLSEFGRPAEESKLVDPDIPDPIGRSLDFYRQAFAIIKEGIERVVKSLEEE
jgi:protein-tyrosine phosphatase